MEERYDSPIGTLLQQALNRKLYDRPARTGPINYRAADELYTYNGIANKIITAPAEDAISSGFCVKAGEQELDGNDAIMSLLEDLEYEKAFSTVLSWDRLYGGGVVLMLVNDGGTLEDPLDEARIKNVERLEVYTPEDVSFTEDYVYSDPLDPNYGKPQFYTLTGYYGNQFLVHESRLLLFHGSTVSNYTRRLRQGWGGTVLEQVGNDIQRYDEGLRLALSALSKLSQGVLKLDGLKDMLMNPDGEAIIQKRLLLIDMYRHFENTMALGISDEYELKNISITGIEKLLEAFQNALSASTSIPATVLFGRSPEGLNSTGHSDMENYYNMVERLQRRTLKPRLMRLVYILSLASDYDYNVNLPDEWNIEFKPLWNASEKEQAEVEKMKADTLVAKATASMNLLNMAALDPQEIRDTIKMTGAFQVDDSLDQKLHNAIDMGGE